MAGKGNIFKRLHKWPGLIIAFVLIYYAVTGILMNHRELISGIDLPREALPEGYHYRNWNNAALKGSLSLGTDSILLYGNMGIWLTDSTFSDFRPFHLGFPRGSDNIKIADIHRSANGHLYAASLFGLYAYSREADMWQCVDTEDPKQRFTGIESIGDTVYALSRSHLYTGLSEGIETRFTRSELPAPVRYDGKVTLFETVWQIHSGEILGLPGKLWVDFMGVIAILLSVTGILYFFFPGLIKRRSHRKKPVGKLASATRWSLKWHNFAGSWLFIFLTVLFLTGMFLRPPLLLFIAKARIAPVKFTHLDQRNPWYDKLRDVLYNPQKKTLLLATADGIFEFMPGGGAPEPFVNQPPVSVMGINTFELYGGTTYLVGSFTGLYLWNTETPEVYDAVAGSIYKGAQDGPPVGDLKVTGTICDAAGNRYVIDYEQGVIPFGHNRTFPDMPEHVLSDAGMSLWNFALEVHTGRIFQGLTGVFYILIVPLTGIVALMVVISGYFLYRRKQKKAGNVVN
ncbi:MAG: PepSY domain-containing protein [Bacteroidales bacterium]|nr:PepSY domain-containing protein [Bacteroidales bacterium]